MGKSLSPALRRELENLEKDADSRKLAMKALKSYVKDLDSKAIPVFLAQVSKTKQTGIPSGEYTISLYEVLARVHGPKIAPQIDNIMTTIVKTLSSSAGSFALHQACSKGSNSGINLDDVKIFTTPRKLIRSLQDPDGLGVSKKQTRSFRTSTPSTFERTPTSKHGDDGVFQGMNFESNEENVSSGGEQFHVISESVSSTEDVFTETDLHVSLEMIPSNKSKILSANVHKSRQYSVHNIVCGTSVVLFAVFLCLLAIGDQDDHHVLVPT